MVAANLILQKRTYRQWESICFGLAPGVRTGKVAFGQQ